MLSLKNKWWWAILGACLFSASAYFFMFTNGWPFKQPALYETKNFKQVKVGEAYFTAELAVTNAQQYQGLSGREEMQKGEAMLFVHPVAGRYQYCMRAMKFNLDFIFINANKVVDIIENVSFEYAGSLEGKTSYDKVLEINGQEAKRQNIKIGDIFKTND